MILPLVGLLSDDVKWQLSELFGDHVSNIGHDKLLILAICTIEGEVSNQLLQIAISKHRADITQLLRELCNDNYLIPEGVGRGAKYTLNTYFGGVNVVNGGVNRENGGVKLLLITRLRKNILTERLLSEVVGDYNKKTKRQ